LKSAFDVSDPIFDEIKEGKSPFDKTFLPGILGQDVVQTDVLILELVIFEQALVEMKLPVKHLAKSIRMVA
jgi:hypothetical protein